uniref:Uncharacterized protein n=1 Tax=viral metagenome TaxID=1070528 RepID=A0A6C0H6D4_9ZZZZ
MFKNIEEIEKKYNLIINKIICDEKIVLSIFNSLEIKEEEYDLNDSNILVIIGLYYLKVKKDNKNAKKYYLMAIEKGKGNANAMNNLGNLYYREKDYKNAKKYFLMSIEKGNEFAMNNLGIIYKIEKDNGNAKKYYLMAIENGSMSAMENIKRIMSEVELYEKLKEMENKNEIIRDEIKRLSRLKIIKDYENKFE